MLQCDQAATLWSCEHCVPGHAWRVITSMHTTTGTSELCGAWLPGGVAAAAAGASSLDLPLPDNPFLVTTVNCGRSSCCPIIVSVDGSVMPCDATVNTSNACRWRMASAALSCFPCDKQVST